MLPRARDAHNYNGNIRNCLNEKRGMHRMVHPPWSYCNGKDLLRICLNFTVNMFFVDFSVYLRLFLAPLPSRFLQIDHYLLHPESENLLKNSSQLNSK